MSILSFHFQRKLYLKYSVWSGPTECRRYRNRNRKIMYLEIILILKGEYQKNYTINKKIDNQDDQIRIGITILQVYGK